MGIFDKLFGKKGTELESDSGEDIFAKMEREQEEFLRRIEDVSDQEVVGLVDASGAGGGSGSGGDSEQRELIIHLAAWKDSSGVVRNEELRVEIPVSEEELSRQMDAINPYSILSLRLRIAEHPDGCTQARGTALPVIGKADADLSRVSAELQKPVIISDPDLGDFKLDRSINWFQGDLNWMGEGIRLNLEAGSVDQVNQCFEVAKVLWKDQSAWSEKVSDYAVSQLLELKNETWLEEGEDLVTPNAFKERMSLNSITVSPDGEFEFWHSDGHLFWGHSIQISGNLTDGPIDADIPG